MVRPTHTRLALAVVTSAAVAMSAAAAAAAAERVVVRQVAKIPGRYGSYSPWSPTTSLFAYSDGAGIAVVDVAATAIVPLRVLAGVDTDCTWSPDGKWLLVRTPSRTPGAQGAALVAVQAIEHAEPHVVADDLLASDFTWAADGRIYWWDYERAAPHAIEPPTAWRATAHGPFPARPILVFAFGRGAPAAHLFDARPDAPTSMVALRALAGMPRSVLQAEGFTDGHLLVRQSGAMDDGAGINRIFDPKGNPVATIPTTIAEGVFAATTVSADGSFVAGECVENAGDGIVAASLYFVAVDGAWNLRVEGVEWGAQPRLSRVGNWIAYTDAEGTAHLGAWRRSP